MEKVKKRDRNANFSREETETLVSLIVSYKNIIENKKSGAAAWQEKENAWKAIEAQFNSSGAEAFRDAKHLKSKYEAMKRDIRRKSAEHYKTGDTVNKAPPLTQMEKKVKELILPVEGGESVYDSDQTVTDKETEKRPIERLADAKIELVSLQKKVIEEELEEKILKNQLMKDEMQYKNELFELEKKQMLLKIELLKTELEIKKNKNYVTTSFLL